MAGLPSALLLRLCCAALLWASLTGCGQADSQLSLIVDRARYDAVFDATLESLRREQFVLNRVDRRLGVITTEPRPASSVLEPWRGDNSTVGQAVESTLHDQHRVVRVQFRPYQANVTAAAAAGDGHRGPDAVGEERPGDFTAAARPFEAANHDGVMAMELRCVIERGHRPGWRLETSSMRYSSYTVDPALARRGIPRRFWEPIGRDQHMESRLLEQIIAKVGGEGGVRLNAQGPAEPNG